MEGTETFDSIHLPENALPLDIVTLPFDVNCRCYVDSRQEMPIQKSCWVNVPRLGKSGVHSMKQQSVGDDSNHFFVRR